MFQSYHYMDKNRRYYSWHWGTYQSC